MTEHCQCEHVSHETEDCHRKPTFLVRTAYGTFRMCTVCTGTHGCAYQQQVVSKEDADPVCWEEARLAK
jgi:hypothetical protein